MTQQAKPFPIPPSHDLATQEPCGCIHGLSPSGTPRLQFCRTHKAAPELLAALKAGRSFLAYAQAYDGARMTAAEVKECDKAMRLTNAAIAKAEGR